MSLDFVHHRLTEDDFVPRFSLRHKLYYRIVRPFLPVLLRQLLQEKVHSHTEFKPDFIDPSLVDLVFAKGDDPQLVKVLYPNSSAGAIVLTHDVETEEGLKFIPKVIDLEHQYGFRSSWNIVPYKYRIDPGVIRFIHDAGHEIGVHGYNHDGRLYYSEKIFRERAVHINRALNEFQAVGFRSPMVHRNLVWLQQLNIEYDASCFDYDPFQPFPGGTGSIWPFIAGKFVELPYTMPQDHTLFYVLKKRDINIWMKKADWILKNRGMILTLTHPDYLQENNHLSLYKELLQYLSSLQNCWRCLPKEMGQWWVKRETMSGK